MSITRTFVALAFLAGATRAGAAELEAPFGFTWGETLATLKTQISLDPTNKIDDQLTIFKVKNAPKLPPGTDTIFLFEDDQYGLAKVHWTGKNIDGDASGIKGREQYSNLKTILTDKYGSPTRHFEYSGLKLYKEDSDFYECLNYESCGLYQSSWDFADGSYISLQINGLSKEVGEVTVDYEGPDFSKIMDRKKSREQARSRDAF